MARDVEFNGVKFAEAIAFLRRRQLLTDTEWLRLLREVTGDVELVLTDQRGQMQRDLIQAVIDAMDGGQSFADFQRNYDEIIKRYGWTAPGDPGWHAQLIFRVNTSNAQNAGRWEQSQRLKRSRPYLRYVTVGDHRVRPHHREWHGVILPIDHPFWTTHYPPNGFLCRCHVQSVSDRDLERYGWQLTDHADARLAIPPDDGWEGNVGMAGMAIGAP
ncbi:Phage (Mu-like) virion morphogenesis protein [Devosia sp. DBB001]|nr:Phage (Mu-like) virion morphogenesis protein [Devosia sp. DBB001]